MKTNYLIILFIFLVHYSFSQSREECEDVIKQAVEDIFERQNYASAIPKLESVRSIAEKKEYYKEQFLATNNLGAAYYQMLDYGNAIKHYLEAYNLAIQKNASKDEMTVLNNIAIVYAAENNLEKAKEYFKKSFDIAVSENIDLKIKLYASNLAKINFELKNITQANYYINKVLDFNNVDSDAVNLNALTTKNHILLYEKKYEEVIKAANIVIEKARDNNLKEAISENQLILAEAYLANKNFDKSQTTISSGILEAVNNNYKLNFYELKSLLALKTGNIDAIYTAKDSIVYLSQLINDTQNKEVLENSQLKFELAESNHHLIISKEKSLNQRNIYLIITLVLVCVIIILGWVFYKRNLINKHNRELVNRNLKIADLELEKERNKVKLLHQQRREEELKNALEKKKLENEIQQRNKQLSDKILFQTTRNEMIEDVINKIAKLPEITENNSTKTYIKELKTYLKEDMKWEEFNAKFNHLNPKFLIQLKKTHPNLTANDIRFLSFIYLNLSYNEIASLLNISVESCRKRKERVSKKLNLSSGKILFEYLSTL